MSRAWKIVLILVAVVCFAVALSYPIRYAREQKENEEGMARLAAIREAGLHNAEEESSAPPVETDAPEPAVTAVNPAPDETLFPAQEPAVQSDESPEAAQEPKVHPNEARAVTREPEVQSDETPEAGQEPEVQSNEAPRAAQESLTVSNETAQAVEKTTTRSSTAQDSTEIPSKAPATGQESEAQSGEDPRPSLESTEIPIEAPQVAGGTRPPEATVEPSCTPEPTPVPTPTPNRRLRTGKAQPYPEMGKVAFDEADILPEFEELYEINPDLVGWINIPGTVVDYPVVQSDDSEFYLKHDFYGEKNSNGQIILDSKCDPYTPSYNLVVSGHSMKNGSMFGSLVNYMYESFWKRNKLVRMDVLTEHREYVAFAAFFSADYDVDEEGFRYNVDIQYRLDMDKWVEEIRENQLYDTGIDVEFGDEFLTLTTCSSAHRKNGRFVLVCRRIREGEEIE